MVCALERHSVVSVNEKGIRGEMLSQGDIRKPRLEPRMW